MGGLGEDFPLWPRNKGRSPKFNARCAGNVLFQANPIGSGYIDAVGYGMAFHDIHPCTMLVGAILFFLLGVPSNCSRIKQYFSPLKRGQSRGLWIPLIPADERSDFSLFSRKSSETSVSWGEIKFFIEMRIIRNMHFAVQSSIGAI